MVVKKTDTNSSEFDIKDYLKLSFDLMNNKLSSIDEKATKTDASLQGVIRTINQMQLLDAGHFTSCPNTISVNELDKKIDKEIQIIDKRLTEFEFLKKYWRIFAITGAVTICGMIIVGYLAFAKIEEYLVNFKKTNNELPKEQLPKSDRTASSGYIIHPKVQ